VTPQGVSYIGIRYKSAELQALSRQRVADDVYIVPNKADIRSVKVLTPRGEELTLGSLLSDQEEAISLQEWLDAQATIPAIDALSKTDLLLETLPEKSTKVKP
jgi:hypothetical protein